MGIVLVFVKEASDLLLRLRHVTPLAQGNGVLEKLPLDVSRQIIPSRDHRRTKALPDVLFLSS